MIRIKVCYWSQAQNTSSKRKHMLFCCFQRPQTAEHSVRLLCSGSRQRSTILRALTQARCVVSICRQVRVPSAVSSQQRRNVQSESVKRVKCDQGTQTVRKQTRKCTFKARVNPKSHDAGNKSSDVRTQEFNASTNRG